MLKLPEKDIWQYLEKCHRPIVLYGMGNGAEKIVNQLKKYGISPDGVFASDGFVRGHSFLGMPVLSFDEAKNRFPDMIALISFGSSLPEVMERLKNLPVEKYAPDVPVFGENVFTLEYAANNIDRLNSVYEMLEDEKSRQTFVENILFKLDGKIGHLTAAETSMDEMYSLLKLSGNENYLDLGAYNGDTVAEFCKRVDSFNSITAIEPDTRNFKKLTLNTSKLKNITLINKAVSCENGEALFYSKGGRKASIGGNTLVGVTTVDTLSTQFTYIKMDVEGEEMNALLGAKANICNNAKMLISAYHRSEDIFSLPLYVKSINPHYKVFLRHLPYIPAWDTNYIFV